MIIVLRLDLFDPFGLGSTLLSKAKAASPQSI